jgi:Tfp pilus assembly major pilin PilA
LAAVGPELIGFSDQAGNFSGLKVRDQALLDDVLERLATSAGITIDERRVGGQEIHYVSLPSNFPVPEGQDMPPPAAALMTVMGRMRSHLYWVEEGDYLYIAGVPQLLMDRASLGPDTQLASWLAETQHVDLSSSIFGATGTVANLPRTMYQVYLSLMQGMGDLTAADYDVWSMPTATQLGLPERGTLGFSFNLGEPYLSLELTYESHPAEVLLAGGGGVAAVAAAGAVAAVALPAYQDYVMRAQVSEGLNLAAAAKAATAQTWLTTNRAPTDRVSAGMTAEARDTAGRYVESVDIADAEIIVRYGNEANPRLAGKMLVITPYLTADKVVVWACGYAAQPAGMRLLGTGRSNGTTIEPKYLPSACRD